MTDFCVNCRDFVRYLTLDRITTRIVKGKKVTFTEKSAYCTGCGDRMSVATIRDENLRQLEAQYDRLEE